MTTHPLRRHPFAPATLILLAGAAFVTGGVRPARANSLLVSDSTHVLAYDASGGTPIGVFIPSGSGGISSPRKILARDGYLYVGNFGYPGVGRFNLSDGSFVDAADHSAQHLARTYLDEQAHAVLEHAPHRLLPANGLVVSSCVMLEAPRWASLEPLHKRGRGPGGEGV